MKALGRRDTAFKHKKTDSKVGLLCAKNKMDGTRGRT